MTEEPEIRETKGDEEHWGRADVDAVCAKCGTVNPDGTLLCKTCGTNLREQRVKRIATGAGLEQAKSGQRAWLAALMSVVGLVVVVFVGLNADRIVEGLVGMEGAAEASPHRFWRGTAAEPFEALAAELAESPTPAEELERAVQMPVQAPSYDGRYALALPDLEQGSPVIGEAVVEAVGGGRFRVVAVAENVELRGWAQLQGDALVVRDTAAAAVGRRRALVLGFAQPRAGGGLECFGECALYDGRVHLLAVKVR